MPRVAKNRMLPMLGEHTARMDGQERAKGAATERLCQWKCPSSETWRMRAFRDRKLTQVRLSARPNDLNSSTQHPLAQPPAYPLSIVDQ